LINFKQIRADQNRSKPINWPDQLVGKT